MWRASLLWVFPSYSTSCPVQPGLEHSPGAGGRCPGCWEAPAVGKLIPEPGAALPGSAVAPAVPRAGFLSSLLIQWLLAREISGGENLNGNTMRGFGVSKLETQVSGRRGRGRDMKEILWSERAQSKVSSLWGFFCPRIINGWLIPQSLRDFWVILPRLLALNLVLRFGF